jgi:hypothetical protein
MTKPIVMYVGSDLGGNNDIEVGKRIWVVPVDHPEEYLNGYSSCTTEILNGDVKSGIFETKNTIYHPTSLVLG